MGMGSAKRKVDTPSTIAPASTHTTPTRVLKTRKSGESDVAPRGAAQTEDPELMSDMQRRGQRSGSSTDSASKQIKGHAEPKWIVMPECRS